MSITPQPKIGETYQLVIEGVQSIVEYPYSRISGVITQEHRESGRDYVWVDILGRGREKLYKTEGLQQICILAVDGRVDSLITVELSEYLGSVD